MKSTIAFLIPAVAAFMVTASLIPLAAHAAEPVAVVRAGDNAMTCEALAAEINTLGAADQVAAAKPKKHGFGFLKVVGAVVPGVGLLNSVAGGVVSSAAAAGSVMGENHAQSQIADTQAMAREAMAGGSAAQQRKARLTTIFDGKHC